MLVAVRVPVARIWVALLAAQAAVLMTVPTFFGGYASFTGPAAVLVAGALAHLAWHAQAARTRPAARRVLAGLLVAGLAVLAAGTATAHMARRVNPQVAPVVADATCVASDDPIYLALTNTLSPNLANRCAPVVDFSGIVYTLAHPSTGPIHDAALRRGSPQYQQFVTGYFATADHVILRRWHIDGLTAQTLATLRHRPLLHPRVPLVYGPPQVSGPPTIGQ